MHSNFLKKIYALIDEKILPAWYISYLFLILFVVNFAFTSSNHNVYLANSFIHSSFTLTQWSGNYIDLAVFNNLVYWPHGPFPAIILIPFTIIFGLSFQENFLKFFMSILCFLITFRLGIFMKLPKNKAFCLAIFFVFGSLYTPVAALPFSTYFMQTTAISLLLLSVYFFLNSKNSFLAGLFMSFAVLTRPTTIFGSLFFIYLMLKDGSPQRHILKFCAPIIFSIIIFGFYNYARFNNALETGRSYQIEKGNVLVRKEVGFLSYKHIPDNLYYMFLKLPDLKSSFPYLVYNPWGMSVFLLSPVLFLIYKANLKDKITQASILAIVATIVPICFYYGIGYVQIGYRYALDFFPFLFLILATTAKNSSPKVLYLLVLFGVLTTWFFIVEMFFLGENLI